MKKDEMTKDELKLFQSKNPHEYIDNSLKVKLTPGRKAFITKLWLDKKPKYTIDDIKYARNRHPYWKDKKMRGSYERNEIRRQEHDYSRGSMLEWDEKTIKKFIDMNKKSKNGRYETKDYELAKYFKTTIPSIQHYRRKYNMAMKILDRKNIKPTVNRIFELIQSSEKILRGLLRKR